MFSNSNVSGVSGVLPDAAVSRHSCTMNAPGQGRGKRPCEGCVKVIYELWWLSKPFIDKSAI